MFYLIIKRKNFIFSAQEIDGETFITMELKDFLAIDIKMGPAKKLQQLINKINDNIYPLVPLANVVSINISPMNSHYSLSILSFLMDSVNIYTSMRCYATVELFRYAM